MKYKIFNKNFFNLLFSLIFIISISLGIIITVNYYEVKASDIVNAGASLLYLK